MKKKIWILFGGLVLIGVLLALCLSKHNDAAPDAPSLPALEQDQTPLSGNSGGEAQNSSTVPADPAGEPAQNNGTQQGGVPETDPSLPVDWNQGPAETKTEPDQTPQPTGPSGNPARPGGSSGTGDGPNPEQTLDPEETGGQIIDPILPPDIFD